MAVKIFFYQCVHGIFIRRVDEVHFGIIIFSQRFFKVIREYLAAYFQCLISSIVVDLNHTNMEGMQPLFSRKPLLRTKMAEISEKRSHLLMNEAIDTIFFRITKTGLTLMPGGLRR